MSDSRLKSLIFTLITMITIMIAATVCVNAATVQNATGLINSSSGVYMRSGASTSYRVVTGIANNKKVTIMEEVFVSRSSTSATQKWYKVKYGNKTGYVRSDLVDNVKYTAVVGKTTDYVNYRGGAGTNMKKYGTLPKNKSITVLCKAKAYGSSVGWYKIKVGNSHRYVCATWIDITGSIFSKPATTQPSTPSQPSGGTSGGSSTKPSSPYSDTSFESYLTSQGFPESYKVQLRKLHSQHPNWVFVAKQTGVDFNTAVDLECRDGVSLINYAYPISYRDSGPNSYKSGGDRTLYKSVATSSAKLGTVPNGTSFTVLDEVFVANSNASTAKWIHVKTSDGKSGYIQGELSSQSYSASVKGTMTDDVNIRGGAGTAMTWIKTLSKGTKIDIVLVAKAANGSKWYKIKNGSGYAYAISDYVKLDAAAAATTQAAPSADVSTVSGTTTDGINYRVGPGTDFKTLGTLVSGTKVDIIGIVKDAANKNWYKIVRGNKVTYASADYIKPAKSVPAVNATVPGKTTDDINFRKTAGSGTIIGGFAKDTSVTVTGALKVGNVIWYRINRNGVTGYSSGDYITVSTEATKTQSVQPAQPATTGGTDLSKLYGTGKCTGTGSYIPKDGATWFNADKQVVRYYMDPRNFLNEDRIYMFEDLSYQTYQSETAVQKILAGTALSKNNYQARWFVNAGKKYDISPISLAARAREETGGGSIAVSGCNIGGTIYYNPYNIGATSSANPVMNGMYYAQKQGWSTKQAAVEGGAQFLAGGYLKNNQHTLYYQRFNVANGPSKVATHQYMTNIMAPYSEALTTKNSYSGFGITNEQLVFEIPVYNGMPANTTLP